MKHIWIVVFLVLLAGCGEKEQQLTAEQYLYFDECEFISDFVEMDCTEYAVRAEMTKPLDEVCYFENKTCLNVSATVQLTDIRVQAVFQDPAQDASINFTGLIRECRTSENIVTCLLPIVQIDREYKQPFTLTVDGEEGKLLVYI